MDLKSASKLDSKVAPKSTKKKKKGKKVKEEKPSADDEDLQTKHPKLYERLMKISEKSHPLDNCSIFSELFLSYINPLLSLSKKMIPTEKLLYNLPLRDSLDVTRHNLAKYFIDENQGLIKSFFKAYKWDNFMSIFCSTLVAAINFLIVIFTKRLLENVAAQLKPQTQGEAKITDPKEVLILSGAIVLGNMIVDLSDNWVWTLRTRMANRFMSGVYGLIFDKIEKIGIINPNEHDQGSIVNYL